jgi:hypothetical protein
LTISPGGFFDGIQRTRLLHATGETSLSFLTQYFHMTKVCSLYDLFGMMAGEIADTPEGAEVIVTDKEGAYPAGAEVIRKYDFEKVISLIN